MPFSADAPTSIGPYVTERLIGRGAMAAVYLCRAPNGDSVAVKWSDHAFDPPLTSSSSGTSRGEASRCGAADWGRLMDGPTGTGTSGTDRPGGASQAMLARFQREVRSLSTVNHPGVVRYLSSGSSQGRPYLVMEHVEGGDLRVYAEKLALRPPAERYARARTIGQALCEAASALHAVGLVHRDIKPGNVLVDTDGRVVLSDLGVVKDLHDASKTHTGTIVGTIAYAAPEQLRGDQIDPRTDLYGIGATLYVLLTGHRPFEQQGRERGHTVPPPSRWDPELPADLEAVVLRLMAPKPADRFATAAAAAVALAGTSEKAEGLVLAGRGKVVRLVTDQLDRVEAGEGSVVIHVSGPMGVGISWLAGVARAGAARRGLTLVEPIGQAAAQVAVSRAATHPAMVIICRADFAGPLGAGSVDRPQPAHSSPRQHPRQCHIQLRPLTVAEVRRTLVAAAPLTQEAASQAERLHRWTGGLPALMTPLLARYNHGARLELPDTPPQSKATDRFMEGLDLDSLEVLGALAAMKGPADLQTIECIVRLPPEGPLVELCRRGLVRASGGQYSIPAQLFALAAGRVQPDPEGLAERIRQALPAPQTVANRQSAGANQHTPEALALSGRLAQSIALAEQELSNAQAHTDRVVEGHALCSLGQILLDLGLFEAAQRRLADASALAKAMGDTSLRRRSHLMRARAQLRGLNGRSSRSRASAAAALDRIVGLASGADQRRSAMDAQILATCAWAAAVLGDARASRQAANRAIERLDLLTAGELARCVMVLARAAVARRDRPALDQIPALMTDEAPMPVLTAWQLATLLAQGDGRPPPPIDNLADGLSDDQRAALRAS